MRKLLLILLVLSMGTTLFAATYGDVNSDGFITIVDALMTARYAVGIPVPGFNPVAADVNRDGKVTIIDTLIIAQYCVGLIDLPGEIPTMTPGYSTPVPGTIPSPTPIPYPTGTMFPGYPGHTPPVVYPGNPSASGLEAGYSDDNKKYNGFLSFLDEYAQDANHYEMQVYERIVLRIRDEAGLSLPDAEVEVYNEANVCICSGTTYADGTFLFFPGEYGNTDESYTVTVTFEGQSETVTIDRAGVRNIDVSFDLSRPDYAAVPLDMLFILDTTGSMGEEIHRLKTTIALINRELVNLSSQPIVRFGMVLYRDRCDEQSSYLTKIIPLTGNLSEFQNALNMVDANGGGDKPEDLQRALQQSIEEIDWNPAAIRLAFVITDAAPKLYTDEIYRYTDAARDAHAAGIKLYSIGAGGLAISGEYALRQMSAYTDAKYIFLTYGETGDSEGGVPGSVSHHTGDDFETDKLESVIIHFAEEELSYLSNTPPVAPDEYFEAIPVQEETREETLRKLFAKALDHVVACSGLQLPEDTATFQLPVITTAGETTADTEFFSSQLDAAIEENSTLSTGEDQPDWEAILTALGLQMSELADETNALLAAEYTDATVMVYPLLTVTEEGFEILFRLLRVETAEVLSEIKLLIDQGLGATI